MKHYKGIIFDLDGTLLDTLEDLGDSVNASLQKRGYPGHTYAAYKKKIGKGFRNLIEGSLPAEHRENAVIDETLANFLEHYDQNYMNKTRPYEGIEELLRQLRERRIKLGVNSNKRTDYTNALIHKFFADTDFVEIYGERKDVPRKPDPAAALALAGLMGYPPEEVLYIGDSGTDMKTGKNAGMDTIGVLWGFRDYEELFAQGATYIVKTPQDIFTKTIEQNGNEVYNETEKESH